MPFESSAGALERKKFIQADEFSRLLRASKGHRSWMLFFTLGNLGLRAIEAHRLTAGDVLDSNNVRVHTAKQKRFKKVLRDGVRVQIDNPNAKPVDEIPVAEGVAKELRRYIKHNRLAPTDKLFPWSKRQSQWYFDKFARLAGIKVTAAEAGEHHKGRGLHCLRHMRGMMLAEAGAPVHRIKALLRQRSITSTEVYLHSTNLRQTVDDLGTMR